MVCDYKGCGKVIEGYSKRQVYYLLEQHKLTHKIQKLEEEDESGGD